MADKSQQTEKASPRRLEKARKEGRFPTARDFVSAVQFMMFVTLLGSWGAGWFAQTRAVTHTLIEQAFHMELTITSLVSLSWWIAAKSLAPLGILGAILLAVTLAFQMASTGLGVSLAKLAPEFNRLNPISKLQSLPKQNLPALVQAALLLPIFGYAVYYIARDHIGEFMMLPMQTVESGVLVVAKSLQTLLWRGASAFLLFGLINLVRMRRQYNNEMKMSKNDVKDEAKESDGNPQMKGRVRKLQRDMRRRQMMREVPTATAVIVNPTHYAIAIKYSMDSMAAPTVVAKGKNLMALRIRTLALSHQVPIIENPPLAQALYKSADVGQEIPAHLYRAVAEILAYIYKLTNPRQR
jgi:flagellar biosynthetic protein FlhB